MNGIRTHNPYFIPKTIQLVDTPMHFTYTDNNLIIWKRGRSGHDRMVVGFTAFCAISAYHHESCYNVRYSLQEVLA
jgi:hypothetical protein